MIVITSLAHCFLDDHDGPGASSVKTGKIIKKSCFSQFYPPYETGDPHLIKRNKENLNAHFINMIGENNTLFEKMTFKHSHI